jgi:hypothetical protein
MSESLHLEASDHFVAKSNHDQINTMVMGSPVAPGQISSIATWPIRSKKAVATITPYEVSIRFSESCVDEDTQRSFNTLFRLALLKVKERLT